MPMTSSAGFTVEDDNQRRRGGGCDWTLRRPRFETRRGRRLTSL